MTFPSGLAIVCLMKKKLFWLPAILLMIGIFYFSSQPAEVSGNLSGGIAYRVVQLTTTVLGQNRSPEELLLLAEKIDFPLRKLAHFTEYALFGMAMALGVLYGSSLHWSNKRKPYCLVQLIGSLYACSDEFHQLFVPGRAGRISDVLIDSTGVLAGWCIFMLVIWLVGRKVRSR